MSRTAVFFSYNHGDAVWLDRLTKHLAVLELTGTINLWSDRRITVGSDWTAELDEVLLNCRVAILLVSSDFLASEFIRDVEIPTIMKRHEEDGLLVVPVIARPCAWKLVDWLAGKQCRPTEDRTLSTESEPESDRLMAALVYELAHVLDGGQRQALEAELSALERQRLGPGRPVPLLAAAASRPGRCGISWPGDAGQDSTPPGLVGAPDVS